jgi:hypothetical protein
VDSTTKSIAGRHASCPHPSSTQTAASCGGVLSRPVYRYPRTATRASRLLVVVAREVVEEEGAPGREDAPVDADGLARFREGDLGVDAVEEGRVEEALEVFAEAAVADGLELGPRRRGGEAGGGGLHRRWPLRADCY